MDLYSQEIPGYGRVLDQVATFPDDPAVAEYMFLLGEVYTEAGEHGRAVAAYQRVVRDFPDFEAASEAGYAAILGLQALIGSAPDDERELWTRLKVDAQIEFAMVFPDDPRSVAAQADAANALFALGQYAEAVELAQHLVSTRGQLEPEIRRTALLDKIPYYTTVAGAMAAALAVLLSATSSGAIIPSTP